jgi:hypothetical protein
LAVEQNKNVALEFAIAKRHLRQMCEIYRRFEPDVVSGNRRRFRYQRVAGCQFGHVGLIHRTGPASGEDVDITAAIRKIR